MGAVCSIENQNLWEPIVLKALKSAGAKGDFPKIYGFVHPPAAPMLMHSLSRDFEKARF